MKKISLSKPVRVSERTYQKAISIADQLKIPITEVFDQAIDVLEREMFFSQMQEAYEHLASSENLDEFKDEIAGWEVTLSDGLK